jgi:hypothetical protein
VRTSKNSTSGLKKSAQFTGELYCAFIAWVDIIRTKGKRRFVVSLAKVWEIAIKKVS